MARRDLAQQYGGVAEYAGLGGQQIVVGGGEAVGVHVHADVEELPFGIVERREVHALRQRPQPVGECGVVQQRRAGQGAGRQVAAVHRGDVAGRQRLAGVDVDPVEDVLPPLRRGLQRVHRAGDAVQTDLPVDDAQLRRRRAAQQVEAYVGGRRAPRRGGGRVQLNVVRGQRGVHGLEEAPGVTGQVPEPGPLGVGQRGGVRRGRAFHEPQDHRAEAEQRRQDQRQCPAAGEHPDERQKRRDIVAIMPAAPLPLGLGGGHPVQQSLSGHDHPPERAKRGVQAAGRRQRQRGERCAGAKPARPVSGAQQGALKDRDQRRCQRQRIPGPRRDERQPQLGWGQQAAQEVVDHPHAVRQRQAPAGEDQPDQLPVAAGPAVQPPQPRGQRGWTAVRQHHVSQKTRPGQRALDQVVGQYAAPRKLAVQRAVKVCHPVDALAAVDAHAGQVHPQ